METFLTLRRWGSWLCVALLLATAFTTGCTKDEYKPRTIEVTVHPNAVLVSPLPPYSGSYRMPGFRATSKALNPEKQEFSVKGIAGFEFEEGYEQVLKVEMTKDPADLQDSRGFTLKLISVISKTKKQ